MATYRLYATAIKGQGDMWDYTVKRHGEKQAESYTRGLVDYLEKIANDRKIWRQLPASLVAPNDIDYEIYCGKYRHYFIYFKVLENGDIGVMSILHEMRDMTYHLAHDLDKLV